MLKDDEIFTQLMAFAESCGLHEEYATKWSTLARNNLRMHRMEQKHALKSISLELGSLMSDLLALPKEDTDDG